MIRRFANAVRAYGCECGLFNSWSAGGYSRMMRRVFRLMLHLVGSLLLLAAILCGTEITLRFCESDADNSSNPHALLSALSVDSQYTHHQLKPVNSTQVRNGDTGISVELKTNSYGLRGDEVTVPKPSGVFRIVCLGDESVLAPETPKADSFVDRLQQLLQDQWQRPVEVINAGVPGYCPLLSYLQFKHSLLVLQPDLVILNFDMSDVADDYKYRRHTVVDEAGTPVACSQATTPNDLRSKSKLIDDFYIGRWCKRRLRDSWTSNGKEDGLPDIANPSFRFAWISDNPPDWSIYIRQTLSSFDHLKMLCATVQSDLIVATYPVPWQVSASASCGPNVRESAGLDQGDHYIGSAAFQILDHYCAAREIAFVDASPTFRDASEPDSLFLETAPRFSSRGHAVYADVLARFVNIRFTQSPEYRRDDLSLRPGARASQQ